MDGIEATRILTVKLPQTAIIALSMMEDEASVMDMLHAGAKGYLQKNAHKKEIIEAIHVVSENNHYYCNNTSTKLARMIAGSRFGLDSQPQKVDFTEREKEIIRFICQELTTEQIASELHLSPRTIDGYREKIIQKTQTRNLAGLAVFAIRQGIFKP